MNNLIKAFLVLCTIFVSLTSHAEQQTKRQLDSSLPIKLEADKAEIDTQKGVSTYSGSVKISQGKIAIEGDKLTISSSDNRMQSATVTGDPAKFSDDTDDSRPVSAVAPTIVYDVNSKTLRLLDGAELIQGKNKLKGKTIDYEIDSGKVNAAGATDQSERIEIVLFPEQMKQPEDD